MGLWLVSHIGTIIVCAILIAVVALVIWSMVKDRKKGKSSCGCSCSQCAMSGACHSNREKDKK